MDKEKAIPVINNFIGNQPNQRDLILSEISMLKGTQQIFQKSFKKFYAFQQIKTAKLLGEANANSDKMLNKQHSLKTISIAPSQRANYLQVNKIPYSIKSIQQSLKKEDSISQLSLNQNVSKIQMRLRNLNFNIKRSGKQKQANKGLLEYNPQIYNEKIQGTKQVTNNWNNQQSKTKNQMLLLLKTVKHTLQFLKDIKQMQINILKQLQLQKTTIKEEFQEFSKKVHNKIYSSQYIVLLSRQTSIIDQGKDQISNKITQIVDQLNQTSQTLITKFLNKQNRSKDIIGKIVKNLELSSTKFVEKRANTQKTREDDIQDTIQQFKNLIDLNTINEQKHQQIIIQTCTSNETNQNQIQYSTSKSYDSQEFLN